MCTVLLFYVGRCPARQGRLEQQGESITVTSDIGKHWWPLSLRNLVESTGNMSVSGLTGSVSWVITSSFRADYTR